MQADDLVMRFTCTIQDEVYQQIEERYGAAGRSKPAVVAAALDDLVMRSDALCQDPMHQQMHDEYTEMIATLAQVQADRDRLAVEVADLVQVRAEAGARDQVLAQLRDEVGWLRGQVALLNEKQPAALPEIAGPGRRPWWKFW